MYNEPSRPLKERWVAASMQPDLNPHTIDMIQGLGFLEEELKLEERKVQNIYNNAGGSSIEYAVHLARLLTLSRLWLLGAYELVRMMDQRLRSLNIENEHTKNLNDLKKTIAKYRMPLAKLERAGKKGEELVAWPYIFGGGEVAWQIDNEVYSRQWLSYQLLTTLERLRS